MTTYKQTQDLAAAQWKSRTTIPDEARAPAPYGRGKLNTYDFCLPSKFAEYNLLEEVRSSGLALFQELGIPWHMGIRKGPSNHLLSSQVQCVNALGQMVVDPKRIMRAFGRALGTQEVFEVEPGRFMTFEYIGPTDYFNEATNGVRTRGSNCTSVDAAFLHRTVDGLRELVLIEWKYTESYRKRKPDPDGKDKVRRARYEQFLKMPDSPVRYGVDDALTFVDLLDEPLYQLTRQQLFAHELEKAKVHDVDRVRVAHVLPKANHEYQKSVYRDSQKRLGATVYEIWSKLLVRPDRFVALDSEMFLDPVITSDEYVARYGGTSGN